MCIYVRLCACVHAGAGPMGHNDKYNRYPNDNPDLNPNRNPHSNPELNSGTNSEMVTLFISCEVTDRVIVKETVIVRAAVPAALCVPARV